MTTPINFRQRLNQEKIGGHNKFLQRPANRLFLICLILVLIPPTLSNPALPTYSLPVHNYEIAQVSIYLQILNKNPLNLLQNQTPLTILDNPSVLQQPYNTRVFRKPSRLGVRHKLPEVPSDHDGRNQPCKP
jgi:hypothetical protein